MPLIIIPDDEELTYIPDQPIFRNMPAELLDGLQALADTMQASGQAVPDAILSVLTAQRALRASDQDVCFFYKRLPGNIRAAIVQRHTVNGLIQYWPARWEMGYEALTGWKNVLDAAGHPVPFAKQFIAAIPGNLVNDIGVLVDDGLPGDYLKNSSAWLNGTSPLTV